MDPWDDRDRPDGSPDPFRDLFEHLEEELERMQGMFDDVFRKALEHAQQPGDEPFVYGFTMRVGPDGEPRVEPFGNTGEAPTGTEGTDPRSREPVTDVMETDDQVTLTVELPGVRKDDLDVHVRSESVGIRVDDPERPFSKDVGLPCRVRPETSQATYKNGILDLTVERREPRESGHRVPIE